jgi:hypothetical protein
MFRLISLTVLVVTSSVFAHARLKTPMPRNNSDLLKDPNGPCGNVPRTALNTQYTAGQVIPVAFEETVTHAGCFTVNFSEANDSTFTRLKTVTHSNAGGTPRQYTTNATLPAGITCANCTLQLVQFMLTNYDGGACPPATIPAGSRYYSCADIRVVAAVPDAGSGGGAGGSGGGAAGGAGGGSAGGAGGSGGGATGGGAGGGTAGGSGGGGEADAGTPGADAGSTGGGAGGSGGSGGAGGMGGKGGGAGGSSGGVVQGNDPAAGCSAMPVGALAALALAIALRRRQS